MRKQKLNILHINNIHYLRGGSEAVCFNTADILDKHSHRSFFFSMSHPQNQYCDTKDYFAPYVDVSSNGNGFVNKLKTASRVLYSFEAKKCLSRLLADYPVDIAHLHNIYYELSSSVIDILKERNIPMVMTLHDYKPVCASYSMLVDEKPCEACSGGRYFHAIKKKCVKDSLAKSMIATLEMYLHNKIRDVYANICAIISPSIFLKYKLGEMGFKKEIIYLPNFIDSERFNNISEDEKPFQGNSLVYFGRLSPRKGLQTLIETAKKLYTVNQRLIINIIGEGEIKQELEQKVKADGLDNVRFLGYMKGEALFREVKKSLAVVLPSEWYENNPVSVLETFALEKPVIGSRIGGIPELVMDGITGYTFEPGNANDLKAKIELLINDSDKLHSMGKNARKLVETKYNPELYYNGLMAIYEKVLQ